MLFKMRAERTSCARHITLDWIGLDYIDRNLRPISLPFTCGRLHLIVLGENLLFVFIDVLFGFKFFSSPVSSL